jgi:hydrogenase maturation protein HypF
VGFRPFVYRIATQHSLTGWVRNVAGTVEIHVEGSDEELELFERDLFFEAPPVARIADIQRTSDDVIELRAFEIVESADADGIRPVTPDLAMCADCEAELFDRTNRRYRHPFITCTNCGPRYTVINSLPYDRERTSMSRFPMCADCESEYRDPGDRRYHAETVACPSCGPRVWLAGYDGRETAQAESAIREASDRLRRGQVVAMRGVGGFHLACDATNEDAVRRLRQRKHRDEKPFAVMVRTVDDARDIALISAAESSVLRDPARPVVLLRTAPLSKIAASVAPGLDRIGVMLAYTPLHALLLSEIGGPLVMTSGNLSDEPIAIDNHEALDRLKNIADVFLLHDREILSRADDSVVRIVDEQPVILRRARGYIPQTLALPIASPRALIAVGPHLKNTFTLVRENAAHVSPHIGDLDTMEGVEHFRNTLARYEDLFRITPEIAVRDMHPGYLSTGIAEDFDLERVIPIQHHHAHVAAVAAEHGIQSNVVGLAFDGTGWGDDGNVWGAETLVADLTGYRRAARLRYVPLPGGDIAAREPWRVALGYQSLEAGVADAFALAFEGIDDRARATVERQIERRLNTPLASSMGRLFDAVSAILGLRQRATYEGQAAMELESLAGSVEADALDIPIASAGDCLELDPLPMLVALAEKRKCGVDVRWLAAALHESIIGVAAGVAQMVANDFGLDTIALSGGTFQNARILSGVRRKLEARGFKVLVPRQLGPNDGAISYGQAAIAASLLAEGR